MSPPATSQDSQNFLASLRLLLERSNDQRSDLVTEIQACPIFTETLRAAVENVGVALFSQYGLLGGDAHMPDKSD